MNDREQRLLDAVDAFVQSEVDAATTAAVAAAVAPLQATITDLRGQVATLAAQATTDASTIADLRAQIVALNARIAELEAGAQKPFVTYGANIGGYAYRGYGNPPVKENEAASLARIRDGFGGRLPAIRVWSPYNGTLTNTYKDPSCQIYVFEISPGMTDAQLDAMFKTLPPNSVLAYDHEQENPSKGRTPAQFQAGLVKVGAANVRSGRTDITVCPMPMGVTFDPTRAGSKGPWQKWIPNPLPPGVGAIGADLYPWTNDSPMTVIKPVMDAAAELGGVPIHVGEFGCGSTYQPDANRAAYTRGAFEIFSAHPEIFRTVLVYEADNGAEGAGWPLLPAPDGSRGFPLTAAVVREYMKAVPNTLTKG